MPERPVDPMVDEQIKVASSHTSADATTLSYPRAIPRGFFYASCPILPAALFASVCCGAAGSERKSIIGLPSFARP